MASLSAKTILGAFIRTGAIMLASACAGEESVPRADGRICKVSKGDTSTAVIAKCGNPCASGVLPKGPCRSNQSFFSVELCSNWCRIYGDTAVCSVYEGEGVVSILEITSGQLSTLSACHW